MPRYGGLHGALGRASYRTCSFEGKTRFSSKPGFSRILDVEQLSLPSDVVFEMLGDQSDIESLVSTQKSSTISRPLRRGAILVCCWFQAWVGGFSNLMDELRTFMAGRLAPFRLKSLRAIFVTPEDEVDEEDKVHVCTCAREACIIFSR